MSKSNAEEDERLNPKLAASCFDFLLIELVPMAYRVAAELAARDQALLSQHGHGNGQLFASSKTTARDRTSLISSSADGTGIGARTGTEGEVDEDETSEAVFHKLDALGYRVGQGLIER